MVNNQTAKKQTFSYATFYEIFYVTDDIRRKFELVEKNLLDLYNLSFKLKRVKYKR